jgi:hypothetical protein
VIEAVANTEEFVRANRGDARSFSLDSPENHAPRTAALRKAGWKPGWPMSLLHSSQSSTKIGRHRQLTLQTAN